VARPRVPDRGHDRLAHGVPTVLGTLQPRRLASLVATMRSAHAILAGLLFAAPACALLTVFA
jgi:hypothetical protein